MNSKAILIVDDEVGLLEALADVFEAEGYRVETAVDGREALERLHGEEKPDLVILDLMMPVVSGNEVFAAMRADPALAGIPVIVSTSDPSRGPSGAFILKKPVDVGRLVEAVRLSCEL
jgi:two-component system, sensor histidine kinase and response regulator